MGLISGQETNIRRATWPKINKYNFFKKQFKRKLQWSLYDYNEEGSKEVSGRSRRLFSVDALGQLLCRMTGVGGGSAVAKIQRPRGSCRDRTGKHLRRGNGTCSVPEAVRSWESVFKRSHKPVWLELREAGMGRDAGSSRAAGSLRPSDLGDKQEAPERFGAEDCAFRFLANLTLQLASGRRAENRMEEHKQDGGV